MRRRLNLTSPLGRWGFTLLALLAITNGQYAPALVCTSIALYAWNTR